MHRFRRTMGLSLITALAASACVGPSQTVPPGRTAMPPASTAQRPNVERPAPARPTPAVPRPAAARPAMPPVSAATSRQRPPPGLDAALFELWRAFPGKTGIAVRHIDGDWALSQRGGDLFPQQSVSKLWVTMTVLDQVDQGRIRLSEVVRIGPDDLTLFHQPIAARVRANGAVSEPVASLIEQAMTKSDNTANDALLRKAGGSDAVRAFVQAKGLGAIRFGPGERRLQSRIAGLDWDQSYAQDRAFQAARAQLPADQRQRAMDAYLADPIDGASPDALALALARLARGELLSAENTDFLLAVMARSTSGPKRLKGGLPLGWSIAHKTGTGQELGGLATGYNDIGIITAPDGSRYAVVVMLASTTASVPQRMELMQAVTRAVATYHGR